MKKLTLLAALTIGAATPANAALVAGWDFSQYTQGAYLSTDFGTTVQNELTANYSSLDPTFNAGAESAAFGRMILPFAADPNGAGLEPFLNVDGSLASNLAGTGTPYPFDSGTILISEGQTDSLLMRMLAQSAVSIVFEADLTSASQLGSNWVVSFGAQTLPGSADVTIGIAFSADGTTYAPAGQIVANGVDTAFSLNLGGSQLGRAFVRFDFQGGGATIDNLAILADLAAVPEPATASLLGAGLLGLAWLGRRRP